MARDSRQGDSPSDNDKRKGDMPSCSAGLQVPQISAHPRTLTRWKQESLTTVCSRTVYHSRS
eukprot:4770185-Pyramimonas_sp.AAC.1